MRSLIIICLTAVIFYSCEESFNPFGEYEERYVLNCILRGDTTLQVAAVARTYSTGGFDPYENKEDPFISGADVRVWYKDSVYLFRDTSIVREDTTRYKNAQAAYITNRFLVDPNQNLEIEVMLPNGRRLKSATKTPERINFTGTSTTSYPVSTNFITIGWSNAAAGSYYLPSFSIVYYKTTGTQSIRHVLEVPEKYVDGTPVYFKPGRITSVLFKEPTIIKALQSISEGDPDKGNYSVELRPHFKVYTFDDALSKYYSTTSQTFETLSVRLDENDYTNVEGGFGVFGSFTSTQYMNIRFLETFINEFGYKAIP